jgi:hypothetical protein
MSNPTSNFNWQMPTNTDLVSQLPADFEVFGQAVDTSLADLKGGTTGQVLKKNTDTDMDFVWAADSAGMTNPMTTTGDTIYSSSGSTPARLGIGTAGQILQVNSGATAPEWAAAPSAGANWSIVNSGGTALTGASTITISGISGADKLMVIVNKGSAGANAFINIRFNSDSGNNYWLASGTQNAASTYSASNTAFKESDGSPQIEFAKLSSNASSQFSGFLELSGGNAAGTKVFTTASGSDAAGGNTNQLYSGGGLWLNSETITSVSIISTVGNFDNGNIYVYKSA